MMRKVLIKGCIGNRNFGDDLLVYAVASALARISDECDYYFLSEDIKYLTGMVDNIKMVQSHHLRGTFDVVLYAGGTQFASFKYEPSRKFPRMKRLIFLMFHPKLLCLKLFNKVGFGTYSYKKMFLMGLGIGPFYRKDGYFEGVMTLLKSANILVVRDLLSCRICEENNIKYVLGADLAYSLHRVSGESIKAIVVKMGRFLLWRLYSGIGNLRMTDVLCRS